MFAAGTNFIEVMGHSDKFFTQIVFSIVVLVEQGYILFGHLPVERIGLVALINLIGLGLPQTYKFSLRSFCIMPSKP